MDLTSIIEILGIVLTVGAFHAATFRWTMTRINEVDSNSAKRDHQIEERMLSREECLRLLQLYDGNAQAVKEELHRLNARIDALLLRGMPDYPSSGPTRD